jgi:hypothetical protein
MTFTVADKGELDTIVVCGTCGEEKHFNYSGTTEAAAEEIEACYQAWVEGLCEGAAAAHECRTD